MRNRTCLTRPLKSTLSSTAAHPRYASAPRHWCRHLQPPRVCCSDQLGRRNTSRMSLLPRHLLQRLWRWTISHPPSAPPSVPLLGLAVIESACSGARAQGRQAAVKEATKALRLKAQHAAISRAPLDPSLRRLQVPNSVASRLFLGHLLSRQAQPPT